MPRSKQRKHHHDSHHPHPAGASKAGKARSAVTVAVVFFAILGLGIAFFATDNSILWMALGALVGGVAGYFFGKQIDRSLADK